MHIYDDGKDSNLNDIAYKHEIFSNVSFIRVAGFNGSKFVTHDFIFTHACQ